MDCKPSYLHQFALLGNIYSRDVLQVSQPRIGLLNIGEEECKGNDLAVRTHALLRDEPRFHFAGNCEGRDVLSGEFDVVVCDGFTGNVLLKFLESVGSVLLGVCSGPNCPAWTPRQGGICVPAQQPEAHQETTGPRRTWRRTAAWRQRHLRDRPWQQQGSVGGECASPGPLRSQSRRHGRSRAAGSTSGLEGLSVATNPKVALLDCD